MDRSRIAQRSQPPDARASRIAQALGAWYDRVARDLPWRRTRDPWAILLSEVMLQQTRVETVVPYYRRMLERFPDASSMASAPLDDVLTLWSGLGYYRRARSLWLCAREVTEAHRGRLPSEVAILRELPGIGAYTAGAVASIAFDRPEPLVDGNVARVLSRLAGIHDDVRSVQGQKAIWAEASRLVPHERPGRFNQALMELGATVCTPRSPGCAVCPLETECHARREGQVDDLPVISAKRSPIVVAMIAAVLRDRTGRPLLAQRPAAGLFAGLWEPPMVEGADPGSAARGWREAGLLARGARLTPRGELVHVLSHRELRVSVFEGRAAEVETGNSAPSLPAPYVAIALADDPKARGLSTLARRVLEAAPPRGAP